MTDKSNFWIRIIGLLGALAVVFGAFGAHFLSERLSDHALSSYKTGVLYHMIHSVAMLGVLAWGRSEGVNVNRVLYLFLTGIILFSGSIYLLSTGELTGMPSGWLGPITPLGGLIFISGWVFLIFSGRHRKKTK